MNRAIRRPAILIDNATASNRAVNIPEFVNINPDGIDHIEVHVADGTDVVSGGK